MKLHRFYVGTAIRLDQLVWVHDHDLLHQWHHVLRLQAGQQIILFDARRQEKIYRLISLNDKEAELTLVTEMVSLTPKKEISLFWTLLKRDKNEWVVQKCTELGVSHLIPILSQRSEKKDLSQIRMDRWRKIAIEAAEQCGRSDLPAIRPPISLEAALKEYDPKLKLYYCEKNTDSAQEKATDEGPLGVFVGPEGGWTDEEKEQFIGHGVRALDLHDFTLRAETACTVAVAKLLQ